MTDAGRDPGLQAERTHLAWTRTSLAALANGVLLLAKDPLVHSGRIRLVVGVLVLATAAGIYAVGVRRQKTLAVHPLPRRMTARNQIAGVGVATLILTAVVLMSLLAPLVP